MPHRFVLTYNPTPFREAQPEPESIAIGTLERQRAELDCGSVAYLRHGEGTPLLLCHGIPTSARLWEPLLGILGERYDCIAPDLLGLGRSMPKPGADLSSPGQADMLAALLDRLGIDEVDAVFHDQGGAHGSQFLKRHGDRVRAVIFTNVVCFDNWPVPAIDATMLVGARIPALLRLFATLGLLQFVLGRLVIPYTLARRSAQPAILEDWFHAANEGGEALDAWRRYVISQSPKWSLDAVPTLEAWEKPAKVLWAAHDRYLPVSWAAKLAATIPGAANDPELLPFAGHFWQLETPVSGAQAIRRFFDSL